VTPVLGAIRTAEVACRLTYGTFLAELAKSRLRIDTGPFLKEHSTSMTTRYGDRQSSTGRNSVLPAFPVIEGYKFLQTIARSSKSEVYVAYSEELRDNVAIKVLRTGPNTDRSEEERFERERTLLTRVKHPAVIDLLDWGHGQDFRYIVTEYFPSGSLELRIRNLMTVSDSVDIFVQVAGALVAVHNAGLCHRDLKPANIMMRPDGRIVLIDFGLAKPLDGGQLTNAGEVRGSPYYISPEQAEGAQVDQRSDLYSLGIIFYEMLTGQRPFRGNSVVAIIQAHRNEPIPVLPDHLSRFQRLIDGLLAKNPAERFPTAAAALNELARMKV
jgi:serine/threonine protein kinase